ncbi:DUF5685 family protein [Nocardia bhagyanarayanae]|uniref:Regulatory protein n=1 Tax=Nocardia bhagyanarayanae TaxID=1215925 RepID=A0A543F7P6_9NOCA|nr:DUF5685 family protein [Nocardia bhagyanarayanae]TQM29839.1 hypothetical protein FB390_1451 [Nocardia bhagyanarayanae]
MLRPCSHGAEKYGIDAAEWRAHMCGLCLGLRDSHGQLARTATNTDAILLSVLTEAQLPAPSARTTAGRCPLRGMQRAEVAAADSPGVLLASTASLLLGSAKLRDHVADGDASRLAGRPMARMSTRWADSARRQAALIDFNVEPLVAAIYSQQLVESRAAALHPAAGGEGPSGIGGRDVHAVSPDAASGEPPVTLDELTAPTALCAAELFAHTSILANRPENADHLRTVGEHFGRIAHLSDAVADLDDDTAHGRFNPLAATGTTLAESYELVRESDAELRRALAAAQLADVPTVRWMLLDPLHALVRRLGKGAGAVTAHACNATRDGHAHAQRTTHRPPTRRPNLGQALTIVFGVYCTGYACCADHTSPCTGERKDAWWKSCDCGSCCDCGECCSGCGDCCSCGGCCDC